MEFTTSAEKPTGTLFLFHCLNNFWLNSTCFTFSLLPQLHDSVPMTTLLSASLFVAYSVWWFFLLWLASQWILSTDSKLACLIDCWPAPCFLMSCFSFLTDIVHTETLERVLCCACLLLCLEFLSPDRSQGWFLASTSLSKCPPPFRIFCEPPL